MIKTQTLPIPLRNLQASYLGWSIVPHAGGLRLWECP